jgi:hypothetical protein
MTAPALKKKSRSEPNLLVKYSGGTGGKPEKAILL